MLRICPSCSSEHVEVKGIWVEGECVLYKVVCNSCRYRGLYDPRYDEMHSLWSN